MMKLLATTTLATVARAVPQTAANMNGVTLSR